jgi:hypothetical protein
MSISSTTVSPAISPTTWYKEWTKWVGYVSPSGEPRLAAVDARGLNAAAWRRCETAALRAAVREALEHTPADEHWGVRAACESVLTWLDAGRPPGARAELVEAVRAAAAAAWDACRSSAATSAAEAAWSAVTLVTAEEEAAWRAMWHAIYAASQAASEEEEEEEEETVEMRTARAAATGRIVNTVLSAIEAEAAA